MKTRNHTPRAVSAAALLLAWTFGSDTHAQTPEAPAAQPTATTSTPVRTNADGLSTPIFFGKRPATEEDHDVAIWGPRGQPSPGYCFEAAKIITVDGPMITGGRMLTRNGVIEAVGPRDEIKVPTGYEVVDCGKAWIVPGLVDLHCHVASASFDLNDTVHPTNPEFRTLDLITLDHEQIKDAMAAGVTSVLYIPGSGSNMGGFGTLTKTAGDSPEDALIRFPGSLKIAQAGNPERRAGDLGSTVVGMNQGLRFALQRGKRYHDEWVAWEAGTGPKPEKQLDLEYLRGLFRHEYPVSVHTQIYQVVLETIRELRMELDLWTVIVHGTFDAYRLSEDARNAGVPVANGPRQYQFDRKTGQFIGLGNAWYRGGPHGWRSDVVGLGRDGVGINTDSPVVAQQELPLQAAMAVRLGLPHEVAIRAITINPAVFAGIDHRVGSLVVGKDADFGVWTGDPLDPRHHPNLVVVNGKIVHRHDSARPRF